MIWAITESGKRNPFDAEPSPKGNSALALGADGIVRSRVVPKDQRAGMFSEPLYLSHFATCPEAERFRRTPARPETSA